MERKRRGNDRGTMVMATAIVFTAGDKVEMKKKSWSSPPRFARLRSGNGEEAMQLGGAVTVLDGGDAQGVVQTKEAAMWAQVNVS
ncbi:hypothetical protein [Oryza sativa Japonica Group]|uniref:Uncharacterized protein n=1 Tax=Oryza sativa subsp. japonica TaxID=39947 RepID=Q5ZCX5_ORYSJ|nr:hypothetical protein [Oryza sativa Japonica Group]